MRKIVISVTDAGYLQGKCKCGWTGSVVAQTSGLVPAMQLVDDEIALHTCPPKEKKPRKRKVKSQ